MSEHDVRSKKAVERPEGCVRMWSDPGPPCKGPERWIPAYQGRYQETFVCENGRHASLYTYDELSACMDASFGDCPIICAPTGAREPGKNY